LAEPASNLDLDVTVIQIDYEPGTPDPGRIFRSMDTTRSHDAFNGCCVSQLVRQSGCDVDFPRFSKRLPVQTPQHVEVHHLLE
jgi:hypothetical protein